MPTPSDDLERIIWAYTVIGVPPESSALRIKRAYRQLAKTWHPDKLHPNDTRNEVASERIREINDAYNLIRHAPLRYQSRTEPAVSAGESRHERRAHPSGQDVDRLEYVIRIMVGFFVGLLASFIWMLNDLPLAGVFALPVLIAAASAIYGDKFWHWILKHWWLW